MRGPTTATPMRARLAINPTMARRFDRKCRPVTAHGRYAATADSASSTLSATGVSSWPCIMQSFRKVLVSKVEHCRQESAAQAGKGHSLDKQALGEEEQDDKRRQDHDAGSHQLRPVGIVRAEEIVLAEHQRI